MRKHRADEESLLRACDWMIASRKQGDFVAEVSHAVHADMMLVSASVCISGGRPGSRVHAETTMGPVSIALPALRMSERLCRRLEDVGVQLPSAHLRNSLAWLEREVRPRLTSSGHVIRADCTVRVLCVRGQQSFRVFNRLCHDLPAPGTPSGRLLYSVASSGVDRQAALAVSIPSAPARPSQAFARDGVARVALSPRAACLLAHEALGHESELWQGMTTDQNVARLLNWRLPERLSVWDDPTIPASYGGYQADESGDVATRELLIHGGTPVRMLGDNAMTSGALRVIPRHRGEHLYAPPAPRQSNLVLEWDSPSACGLEELVDSGLIVDDFFEGCEAESCGASVLRAACCEEVRHGKRTGRVSGPLELVVSPYELRGALLECTQHSTTRAIDCHKARGGWVRTSCCSFGMVLNVRCRPCRSRSRA
jgi:hypothetical protein